ncbi:aldehyde dehydrogenase family protein [Marihabitans asiaticum]|uniref:Aldehyde dehydrogenase (NAD+) n=1 Tax=Marihabitans asiaticum TaxID=415218 RepID=A0A560WGK0_9MICO|nr:aldehyde dehydrogenase family protein [Marihabitans asiaticum]TWD16812.1 aldehyde dehydrogenase (NAD+) [Marihabitans asiaticum]
MPSFHNYINGQRVPGDEYQENINPSDTTDVIGLFPRSSAAVVDDAVEAARSAQPGWSATSPQVRADLLERIAAGILDNAQRLGDLLAQEEGKTLPEAIGEVTRAGHIFRFFSGEALRMSGERIDSTRDGVRTGSIRESVGTIGIITPWNFPIAIPAWKVAPALAYGNTVVLKPAELTPASVSALADIIHQANLPPGVFNLVMGQGSVLGDALARHPLIDAISFTGSERVGEQLAAIGAERLMPVQLEMGGKNPLVVAADADLEIAVDCAIQGAFYSTGQRCTASSRIIVDERIHDDFFKRLRAEMSALVVGDARAPGSHIGPVVDARQLQTILDYLGMVPSSSLYGGDLLDGDTDGFYLSPALITNMPNSHVTSREEIFGPVASILPAGSYDEALAIANDTPFGLSAGICTRSLALAEDFQRRSDAGMVMVNVPTAGVDPHMSFGGRKRSSYGAREQGTSAKDFFTQVKTLYVRP